MSLKKRLGHLEARAPEAESQWVVPMEVSIYYKAVERHQALQEGKEPHPYSQEEIAELRRGDLEIVAGGGVVGECWNSKGWQSEEARELLAQWERGARRRVELGKDLPPDRWHEVWGADDDENDKE
jgi:hypothetical protein